MVLIVCGLLSTIKKPLCMFKNPSLLLIGKKIRSERQSKQISQEKLAFEAGVDRSYMGGVERGERNISMMMLFKISEALNVTPSNLLKDITIGDLN